VLVAQSVLLLLSLLSSCFTVFRPHINKMSVHIHFIIHVLVLQIAFFSACAV